MALVSFAAVTTATGAQLDANFAALGSLTAIPCTMAGANTITMTPDTGSNTPAVTAYRNYSLFTGIVASTNTGAVTIQVGSLAALNAYKDSPAGPVALSGGEMIAGNAVTAEYDSALNAGAGGFRVYTSTAFAGGTITSPLVLLGATGSLSSVGVTLSSTLLTGNSLSIAGVAASIASLQVGNSLSTLTRMVTGLATVTYSVTSANAVQDQNFTLDGVQVRDSLSLGMGPAVPAGAGFTGFIPANGTITVRLVNPSTVTLGAATVTLRATAMGFA
jgi:hypothetical protein